MSIFETHNRGLRASPDGDTYYEQWLAGTYIVAGVFHRTPAMISIDTIQSDTPRLFDLLKANKKAIWPNGICGYYAIPIYSCEVLDTVTVEWVHSRPKYRYAMWHEPVLYDRVQNMAEMNATWRRYGSAFRVFLLETIFTALNELAKKSGHAVFPLVNGEQIKIEK